MRRTIFAAVPLAVLALAAPAAAKGGHQATTYKADLKPVAAAPADGATSAKAAAAGIRGQAKLVDGRRDKVQLHVKGLEAGESYTWSVRSAEGDADACAGEAVDAFSYGELTGRRHGHSKARSRSREFAAADGATYAVVVTAADGTDVACGEFQSKAQRKAERRASRAKGKDKAHGKGKHEASDDDKSAGDDEQGDDSDDADAEDDDSAADDSDADAGDDD